MANKWPDRHLLGQNHMMGENITLTRIPYGTGRVDNSSIRYTVIPKA